MKISLHARRAYVRSLPECVGNDRACLLLTHNYKHFLPRGEEVMFMDWTVNKPLTSVRTVLIVNIWHYKCRTTSILF